jgi:hypothetical protein
MGSTRTLRPPARTCSAGAIWREMDSAGPHTYSTEAQHQGTPILSGSTMSIMWKLPSPTCPTIGDSIAYFCTSALLCATHSARRLIGTHTSVGKPRPPGRIAMLAQYAWWRACQRRCRSSALPANSKREPPNAAAMLPHSLLASSTPANHAGLVRHRDATVLDQETAADH